MKYLIIVLVSALLITSCSDQKSKSTESELVPAPQFPSDTFPREADSLYLLK